MAAVNLREFHRTDSASGYDDRRALRSEGVCLLFVFYVGRGFSRGQQPFLVQPGRSGAGCEVSPGAQVSREKSPPHDGRGHHHPLQEAGTDFPYCPPPPPPSLPAYGKCPEPDTDPSVRTLSKSCEITEMASCENSSTYSLLKFWDDFHSQDEHPFWSFGRANAKFRLKSKRRMGSFKCGDHCLSFCWCCFLVFHCLVGCLAVGLSIYLFIHLFVYLFIYSFIYLFMYLFVHLFIYLFIYLFVHVFIRPFIYLFIRSFICSCIYSSIYLFICLFIYSFMYSFMYLFVHLFIYSSIYLFIRLFIYLFIHSFIYLFVYPGGEDPSAVGSRGFVWSESRFGGGVPGTGATRHYHLNSESRPHQQSAHSSIRASTWRGTKSLAIAKCF